MGTGKPDGLFRSSVSLAKSGTGNGEQEKNKLDTSLQSNTRYVFRIIVIPLPLHSAPLRSTPDHVAANRLSQLLRGIPP